MSDTEVPSKKAKISDEVIINNSPSSVPNNLASNPTSNLTSNSIHKPTALLYKNPLIVSASFHEKYKIIKTISKRKSNKVYLIEEIRTNKEFIAKYYFLFDGDKVACYALRELYLLQKLSHPNIIKIKEIYLDKIYADVIVIFDKYEQNFENLIYRNLLLPSETKNRLYSLASAVEYIHSKGIIHRDIKPENIFYDQGKVILGDLDHSREQIEYKMTRRSGTYYIVPPEVYNSSDSDIIYTSSYDIWSLGCVMCSMKLGKIIFDSDYESFIPTNVKNILGSINDLQVNKENLKLYLMRNAIFDENFIDLVCRMLVYDPDKRITATEILNHPYFKNCEKIPYEADAPIFEYEAKFNPLQNEMRNLMFGWLKENFDRDKKEDNNLYEHVQYKEYFDKYLLFNTHYNAPLDRTNFQLIGSFCYMISSAIFGNLYVPEFNEINSWMSKEISISNRKRIFMEILEVLQLKF